MASSVPVASLLGARGADADLDFESEVRYLEQMTPQARREALARLFGRDFPCVVLTLGLEPPAELLIEAERTGVPVLRTNVTTPTAMARLTTLLEDRMAAREVLHGVLLDILGLGVLITGESGIGKSECALDLIGRGHRLRGLGLVNVTDLFGVAATRSSKRIELVVQLERWELGREYDRLGLTTDIQEVLGVSIPLIRMPVAPGRNIAMLVEVAARNTLLRSRGRHAARTSRTSARPCGGKSRPAGFARSRQ